MPPKCKHYVRTWYRAGTLEKPIEMWLCEECGIRAVFDDMAAEIERVKKNGKNRYRRFSKA